MMMNAHPAKIQCLPYFFLFAFAVTVQAADRANIILFVTDDQNKEDVACYRGKVLTPHLDRFAREGIRFDNAHVPSTVCTPSRYTLLTGRFPGNSYFEDYLAEYPRDVMGRPGFNVGLEKYNMNIGNVLRESGYVTGLVGKLHVGSHLKDPEEFARYGLCDVSKKNGVRNPDDPDVIAGWQRNEKWFRQWVMDRGFSWAKHVYWGNVHGAFPRHNPEWTLERQLDELKAILTVELKSQARPFGELVPGPNSVPVEKIEPFVEMLARLKVIKRGFEGIEADTPDPPTGILS